MLLSFDSITFSIRDSMLDIKCLASSIGNIFYSVSITLINSFQFDGFRIDTLILRSTQKFSVGFVPELKAAR